MKKLWNALPSNHFGLIGIMVVAFGVVIASVVLTDLLRLSPCPLCIFQRLLYLLIGVVAIPACFVLRRTFAGLGLLLAGTGFGTAVYQTWMQLYPELVNECSYTDPNLIERLVDFLGMHYPSFFLATGFCTSKEWVFLGLSLANWSVLTFLFLALLNIRVLLAPSTVRSPEIKG